MCGGVLMGWSFAGPRAELWTVGTPLALIGQAMILIGLVLQMDIIWQNTRHTSLTLAEIDEQISDLRQAASQLPGGGKTYRHPAQQPTPQMLIADLQGRLEALSSSMSSEENEEKKISE